jgi:hypothetical protein
MNPSMCAQIAKVANTGEKNSNDDARFCLISGSLPKGQGRNLPSSLALGTVPRCYRCCYTLLRSQNAFPILAGENSTVGAALCVCTVRRRLPPPCS